MIGTSTVPLVLRLAGGREDVEDDDIADCVDEELEVVPDEDVVVAIAPA